MPADFLAFNSDDLISKETKNNNTVASISTPVSNFINDLFPEQNDKTTEDNKWDLIEDNYIITNPNENLFSDN